MPQVHPADKGDYLQPEDHIRRGREPSLGETREPESAPPSPCSTGSPSDADDNAQLNLVAGWGQREDHKDAGNSIAARGLLRSATRNAAGGGGWGSQFDDHSKRLKPTLWQIVWAVVLPHTGLVQMFKVHLLWPASASPTLARQPCAAATACILIGTVQRL